MDHKLQYEQTLTNSAEAASAPTVAGPVLDGGLDTPSSLNASRAPELQSDTLDAPVDDVVSASRNAETTRAALRKAIVQRRRAMRNGVAAVAVISVFTTILSLWTRHVLGEDEILKVLSSPRWIALNLLIFGAFGIAVVSSAQSAHRRMKRTTKSVAEEPDLRGIPALINAMTLSGDRTNRAAGEGLTRLLSRVTSEDATMFTPAQCVKLSSMLVWPVDNLLFREVSDLFRPDRPWGVDLKIAILHTFTEIGYVGAIPSVKKLAEAEAKSAEEETLRETAGECLAALHKIADRTQNGGSLLRASQPEKQDAAVLVRAAGDPANTTPEELLRSSEFANDSVRLR